jgi:hypothetical protein
MTQLASTDMTVARSAAYVLTTFRHEPAADVFRGWLAGTDEARLTLALRSLGTFAYPKDRAAIEGLRTHARGPVRYNVAWGLYEMGDPASAPVAQAFLDDADDHVRMEAIFLCAHLLDAQTGPALLARLPKTTPAEADAIKRSINAIAAESVTDNAKLMRGDAGEWARAVAGAWKTRDGKYALQADDAPLTRETFVAAMKVWVDDRSVRGRKELAFVEQRHALAVAEPSDITALLEVRAALLLRQSDEALHEVRIIDELVSVLHRRRSGAPKPHP